VDAVIAPDGRPWISDGHNRILHRWKLAKLAGQLDRTRVRIKVADGDDFTGRSWDEFYRAVDSRNLVYLDPEVRARNISLAEKIRTLPDNFGELDGRDKPVRSMAERIFRYLGIDSESLVKFAELHFGDRLEEAGLHVAAGQEYDPQVFERGVALALRPENSAFLESMVVRPAYAAKLKEKLAVQALRFGLCREIQSGLTQ
jgi:hypothetical protein